MFCANNDQKEESLWLQAIYRRSTSVYGLEEFLIISSMKSNEECLEKWASMWVFVGGKPVQVNKIQLIYVHNLVQCVYYGAIVLV